MTTRLPRFTISLKTSGLGPVALNTGPNLKHPTGLSLRNPS
jgi:hypothetical protein